MRVLFDNGTPRGVAPALADHEVEEARSRGWDTFRNGELLDAAEAALPPPSPPRHPVASLRSRFRSTDGGLRRTRVFLPRRVSAQAIRTRLAAITAIPATSP
jgi:DNA-binding IclR family transcriptional regulator